MKKYFDGEQKVFYDKLGNGLEVYVLPNKNLKKYHVEVVSRYGSDISDFIPVNEKEYFHLPLGVAHFLEHKLFDMPNIDSFEYFSKTGTYVNAGTTYFYTKYYIDGTKYFERNLDFLLSMVFTPYFEKESVEREKKIIGEEIKMYEDESDWKLDQSFRRCFFNVFVRDEIAGTTESIMQIDSEVLLKAYNTFYQPSNMIAVVTGNISADDVIKTIKNNEAIKNNKINSPIIFKEKKEDVSVPQEYLEIKANIVLPKLKYGFKFDLNTMSFLDRPKLKLYLNAIFSILFNDASKFNEDSITKNLATSYYSYYSSISNIYFFTLEAESDYADLFIEEVDNTLKKINITEEDFERIKKVWYSMLIRDIDSIAYLADYVTDEAVRNGHFNDKLELIKTLK